MNNFKKMWDADVKHLQKLDSHTKVSIFFFILSLFLASMVIGSSLVKTSASGTQPTPTIQTPHANLSLSGTSTSMKIGENSSVTVTLNNTPVSAADIVLTYDPAILTVSNIKLGSVFTKLAKKVVSNGKIMVSASVGPKKSKDLKTGVVFSFRISAKGVGTTTIGFDRTSTITAIDGQNILGETTDAVFTVEQI